MRRLRARRRALLAVTAILTAGLLLLSCPSGLEPQEDDPVDEQTPSGDPALPGFDPATDELVATGTVYDADDGLAAGKLRAPDEILLERDGERVVAAGVVSKYNDGLSYLPFGSDAWVAIALPQGSDELAGLTCDAGYVYTGAGSDVLTVPTGGDTAAAVSLLSDGTVITALRTAEKRVFIGTTTTALTTTLDDLVSDLSANPRPISDTAVPIHVTSFAVAESVVYVGARSSKDRSRDGSSSGGLYSWDAAAATDVAWHAEDPNVSVYDLLVASGALYVASFDGLHLLNDDGTLVPLDALVHPDTAAQPAVYDLSADNGVIYAATTDGLWYSPDGGGAWRLLEPGNGLPGELSGVPIGSVTALGDRVYLGVGGYGVVELRWQ